MSDYVANVNQKVTYCINSDIAICLAKQRIRVSEVHNENTGVRLYNNRTTTT